MVLGNWRDRAQHEQIAGGHPGDREIGQAYADALAGAITADMGTDVIKIEQPDGGDDACKKIGMKIDMQIMDWSTLLQRANNRQGVDRGGWHIVSAFTAGVGLLNPASCT